MIKILYTAVGYLTTILTYYLDLNRRYVI